MGNCITSSESDGGNAKSATALRSTQRSPLHETPFPIDPSPPPPRVTGERIPSTTTSASASPPRDDERHTTTTNTARRLSDKRLSFDRLSVSQSGTKRSSMLTSFEATSMSSGKRSSLQSTLSGSHRRSGTFVSTVDAMWSSQVLSFDHHNTTSSGIAAENPANNQSQAFASSFETTSPGRVSPSTTVQLAISATDHDDPACALPSPSNLRRQPTTTPPAAQPPQLETEQPFSSPSPATRNVLAGRPREELAAAESDTDIDDDASLHLVKSGEELEFAARR